MMTSIYRAGNCAANDVRYGARTRGYSAAESGQRRISFGTLVGRSAQMQAVYSLLERAAPSNATVLLSGETGTGKGQAAESIHRESRRRGGPFVIVDCGALSTTLLESELFGHEKGAFTGAHAQRIGAFEQAAGGTIFLDEIGELPRDFQPKLLRALENRHIRRLGSNTYIPLDVRVITATHRDLSAEVGAGRFRADLYFRLAVLQVSLPPLRERPDDIAIIAQRILEILEVSQEGIDELLHPGFLAMLERAPWPGNVRELRNHLERCLVFPGAEPPSIGEIGGGAADECKMQEIFQMTYAQAKEMANRAFERDYLEELMRRHGGSVARAAEVSGLSRVYLYQLLRRHRMRLSSPASPKASLK